MEPTTLKMMVLEAVSLVTWLLIILLLYFVLMTIARVLETAGLLKRTRRQRQREKYQGDGRPYPPAACGFCDRCEKACEKVYYLPSGRRLCPDCYAKTEDVEPAGSETGEGDPR